jgi:hypothetical protein
MIFFGAINYLTKDDICASDRILGEGISDIAYYPTAGPTIRAFSRGD